MFLCVCLRVCVCVLVISRIYTGGSLVCHLAVLSSLRTRTRIDIRMFYHVSYSDDLCVTSHLFLLYLVPHLPLYLALTRCSPFR